jgi:predicted GNAT family N-acyltransferase
MITSSRRSDGRPVVTKLVASMEEMMQAFAVRAACFVGELDVPYSAEFDNRDFGATHLLAKVGEEPVGTLRLRWFKSFAMPERLAVIRDFRGQGIGGRLLELSYGLAEERGCNSLYCRADSAQAGYFVRHGWTCHDEAGRFSKDSTVALTRVPKLGRSFYHLDDADARALWHLAQPVQAPLKAAA